MVVTLEEMKNYLRVDYDEDDALIENIIWLGLPTVTRQVLDGTYQMNGGRMRHGSL